MLKTKDILGQCSSQDVAASSSDKIELTRKKCGATYIVKAGDRKDEAVKNGLYYNKSM